MNLSIEVIELDLKVCADIRHGLIVDSRAERTQHEVEDLTRAKVAQVFIEAGSKERLKMRDEGAAPFSPRDDSSGASGGASRPASAPSTMAPPQKAARKSKASSRAARSSLGGRR